MWRHGVVVIWHRGVVVITIAQLHSTKPELRFCGGSNLACGVWEICDGEDSDSGPGWKQGLTPFVGQPYHKNNSSTLSS